MIKVLQKLKKSLHFINLYHHAKQTERKEKLIRPYREKLWTDRPTDRPQSFHKTPYLRRFNNNNNYKKTKGKNKKPEFPTLYYDFTTDNKSTTILTPTYIIYTYNLYWTNKLNTFDCIVWFLRCWSTEFRIIVWTP